MAAAQRLQNGLYQIACKFGQQGPVLRNISGSSQSNSKPFIVSQQLLILSPWRANQEVPKFAKPKPTFPRWAAQPEIVSSSVIISMFASQVVKILGQVVLLCKKSVELHAPSFVFNSFPGCCLLLGSCDAFPYFGDNLHSLPFTSWSFLICETVAQQVPRCRLLTLAVQRNPSHPCRLQRPALEMAWKLHGTLWNLVLLKSCSEFGNHARVSRPCLRTNTGSGTKKGQQAIFDAVSLIKSSRACGFFPILGQMRQLTDSSRHYAVIMRQSCNLYMRWIRSYCGQASHSLSPAVGFVRPSALKHCRNKYCLAREYSTVELRETWHEMVWDGVRWYEMVCSKYHGRIIASWFSLCLLEPLLDGTFDLLSQHLDVIKIAGTSLAGAQVMQALGSNKVDQWLLSAMTRLKHVETCWNMLKHIETQFLNLQYCSKHLSTERFYSPQGQCRALGHNLFEHLA